MENTKREVKRINKTAVFLTYNSVGEPGAFPNGPVQSNGHTAIIVQHPKGKRWGASTAVGGLDPVKQNPQLAPEGTGERKAQSTAFGNERERLVADLYAGFFDQNQVDDIDFIVVYVGTGGSEGAIELAASLPHEKVRMVMCDCNLWHKQDLFSQHKLKAPIMMCECGGRSTMKKLVDEFLQSGNVGPAQ